MVTHQHLLEEGNLGGFLKQSSVDIVSEMAQYFKYISEKGIANLAHYSYSGVDNSFCAKHFLKHWWNYCVEFTPLWLAPNLITLAGLFCNIAMYLIMYFYCPTLTEAAPRWTYFAVAFFIFAYQTLDNVDGKQARKTKSSSPLGELFDHCCDAVSVAMFAAVMSSTLRIGSSWGFLCVLVGIWPFYLAHWEEYHAGILVLGEFNGPTEAQVLFIIIELITGIFGSDIWTYGKFSIGNLAAIAVSVGSLATVYQNFRNTFALPNRIPFSKCLLQLLPIVTFTILIVIWASVTELLHTKPHLFIMTVGMIFSYIESRYITQRVCHDDCHLTYPIFIPLAIVVFNSILAKSGHAIIKEEIALWILFSISIVQFLLFAYFTTVQLCNHLKIKVFTIPYPGSSSGGSSSSNQEYSNSLLSHMEEGDIKDTDTNSHESDEII